MHTLPQGSSLGLNISFPSIYLVNLYQCILNRAFLTPLSSHPIYLMTIFPSRDCNMLARMDHTVLFCIVLSRALCKYANICYYFSLPLSSCYVWLTFSLNSVSDFSYSLMCFLAIDYGHQSLCNNLIYKIFFKLHKKSDKISQKIQTGVNISFVSTG